MSNEAQRQIEMRRKKKALIAAAPDMYESLKVILGFFETGEFVRNTANDFEDGWHIKMLPVVKSIGDAQRALAKAEGRTAIKEGK